jgi:uncharacterized protein YjbI with pentapeptide repeats
VRIDDPDLPADLEPVDHLPPGGLDCALLADADLSAITVPGLTVDASRLERVMLTGARLAGLDLRDCELVGCDLANVQAGGATIRRTRISGGRMTGFSWTDGEGGDLVIADCRADYTAFGGTSLQRVRFESCGFEQADFQGAKLKTVVFEDCDLRGADLDGCRFEGVELRGCKLDGIRGATGLRGVAMPWGDILASAGVFAAACGVKLLDPDG